MTLKAYLERYSLDRAIRRGTEYLIGRAIASFSEWLGHDAELSDLDDLTVSRWIRDAGNAGILAPKTLQVRRGDILALWRHAAAGGFLDPPGRIRGVVVPDQNPTAWSLDDLRKLLIAAADLRGYMPNGVQRGVYFETLLRCCYDTGLRRGDVLSLDISDLRDGVLAIRQEKTGRVHPVGVSARTERMLRAIGKQLNTTKPLEYPGNIRQMYDWCRRITKSAGVSPGALQKMRRTGATHVVREHRSATDYLGHSSPGLARRHYIDATQAYGATRPPELLGD